MTQNELAVTPAGKLVLQVKQIQWFDDRYYRLLLWDDTTVFLPSVTTVMNAIPKPRLATWRGTVGNDEANRVIAKAMDKGTRVHAACYAYATKQAVIYDPPTLKGLADINNEADFLRKQLRTMGKSWVTLDSQEEMMMVWRFQQWMKMFTPNVLGAEMTLYSLNSGVAGTLDYAFVLRAGTYPNVAGSKGVVIEADGVWIVDLKTGNENPDYWMQLAKYAQMYAESTRTPVAGAMIIYLDADIRTGIQGLKTVVRTWEELQPSLEFFEVVKKMWYATNPNATPKVFDFPNVLFDGEAGEIPNHFVVPNSSEAVPAKDVVPNATLKTEETTPVHEQESQIPAAAAEQTAPRKRAPRGGVDVSGITKG